MNHHPTHGLHIRKVLLPVLYTRSAASKISRTDRHRSGEDNPFVIRRTFDISATCGRRNTDEADAPITVHFRGERSTTLLRCLTVGAAVLGMIAAVTVICRIRQTWKIRGKYAKKYAHRMKEMQKKMRYSVSHVTPGASRGTELQNGRE